jgi:hypothetical protein
MSGDGVSDIVEAICDLEKNPERAQQLVRTQQGWLAERDWKRVSSRLDATIGGLLLDRQLEMSVLARRELMAQADGSLSKAQLFVDVSEMYFRDGKTGIQRVVRNILAELLAAPPDGFEVCPIYGTLEGGYRYTEKLTPERSVHPQRIDEQPIRARMGDIFLGLDLSAHLFPQAMPLTAGYSRWHKKPTACCAYQQQWLMMCVCG